MKTRYAIAAATVATALWLATTPAFASFRGDTLVATESGLRPISQIKVRDRVWSWNEKTNERELAGVQQKFVVPASKGMRLVSTGEEVFRVTGEHPFWVKGKGWTKADMLAVGDVLWTNDWTELRVASNKLVDAKTFYASYDTAPDLAAARKHPFFDLRPVALSKRNEAENYVYNLEVERTLSFFVGEQKVLVHHK